MMSALTLHNGHLRWDARDVADTAVQAMHDEIDLTPKPGLVDRRGPGAHTDMNATMLHSSADVLHAALRECCNAGAELGIGPELRTRIGRIGRTGEAAMLAATGGINTHRGSLWTLGLLTTAVGTGAVRTVQILTAAAAIARLPDSAATATITPGAAARRRFRVGGALGQARAGFPHLAQYALPALRTRTPLDALLAVMAHLDDTCLLHRGGTDGLADVQRGAAAVLAAGGASTIEGQRLFDDLDRLCQRRRLSPGGSGDLLAAALFLHTVELRDAELCRP